MVSPILKYVFALFEQRVGRAFLQLIAISFLVGSLL
jgi:hypothetical protein